MTFSMKINPDSNGNSKKHKVTLSDGTTKMEADLDLLVAAYLSRNPEDIATTEPFEISEDERRISVSSEDFGTALKETTKSILVGRINETTDDSILFSYRDILDCLDNKTDEEILTNNGWEIVSNNPITARKLDTNDICTGIAVEYLLNALREKQKGDLDA